MDNSMISKKFQENLEKNLKDVSFTFIVKNKLPREITMTIADTFIRTGIEYKSIPEFDITPIQQGSVILFTIENTNKETMATVLLNIEFEKNLLTVKEVVSAIKNTF